MVATEVGVDIPELVPVKTTTAIIHLNAPVSLQEEEGGLTKLTITRLISEIELRMWNTGGYQGQALGKTLDYTTH